MSILSFSRSRDILSWGLWLLVVLTLLLPHSAFQTSFPPVWQSCLDPVPDFGPSLWRRWDLLWRPVRQRLRRAQQWVRLAGRLWSCRCLAEVLQVLTRRQLVRYLGALPVLLALLERLKVRQIINHYCPTRSPIDHGAIGLVMVLNRLMAPRPLYGLVDWLATTWISEHLAIPAAKFNDDRLERTLDALSAHLPQIWAALAQQALQAYHIDLGVLFYDLTALVMTGAFPHSQLVGYGFANNTPKDDPKLKLGVVASRDGGVSVLFQVWPGGTADRATVKTNLEHLQAFLHANGWSVSQVLLVGDSANLNSELAFVYQRAGIRYLTALAKLETVHRELVWGVNEQDFARLPLAAGYWGVGVAVPFQHEGHHLTARGLVVRSDPLRTQVRRERALQMRALARALQRIQSKIGQKYYRTPSALQRHVDTALRHSPAAEFFHVQVSADEGKLALTWWTDANALQRADQKAGRFLLVTNDPTLSYPQMLSLYRQKDALEKRFEVVKQDLLTRPLRVHSDERIQALLLLNLIALLAYGLLERQAQQAGLCLTTRRILEKLSSLQLQATQAWDGSWACSPQETRDGQVALLNTLWQALAEPTREGLPSGALRYNLLPDRLPLQVDGDPRR